MDKNVVFFQGLLDERVCVVEMDGDFLVLLVLQIDPLVLEDLQVLGFLLYHESLEHCVVQNRQNCGDSEPVYDRLLEGAHAA